MNQLLKSFQQLRLVARQPSALGAAIVGPQKIEPEQLDVNYISRRHGRRYRKWYNWPNDFLPFKYERPKLDPPYMRTGDAVRDIGLWNKNSLIPGAEHSKLLESAPEIVRRQFTLEFADRKDVVEFQRRKLMANVRYHPFDNYSAESRIAEYTIKIRNNLNHFAKIDKWDAPRKIRQSAFVNKRGVLLKELYYQDRARFDHIVKVLGITYTPPKLGERYLKPQRKREIRRLTKEYCDRLKSEKLDAYHEELKGKQDELKAEIEKFEAMIKEEEKYLGTQNPPPPPPSSQQQ